MPTKTTKTTKKKIAPQKKAAKSVPVAPVKKEPVEEPAEDQPHPALEMLRERLSSPRLRAPGTLNSYLLTAKNFLAFLKKKETPSESDFRRFFIQRRQGGISERTLRKEFFHVKKLAEANHWAFPFGKDDTPYPENEPAQPTFRPDQVEKMIMARDRLSSTEKFYLAVATTWPVRREELSRIKKIHFNDKEFTIFTAKHGRKRTHLIPDQLKPVFAAYRPSERSVTALSEIFHRICLRTGVEHPTHTGFHNIRRSLTTMLASLLPKNNLDPALLADYAGWSKKSLGSLYGGAAMVGVYRHPEILDSDPYGRDRVIYEIHPWLRLWGEKPRTPPRRG